MSAADALPEYDVRTRHSIRVDASPELAVAAALAVTPREAPLLRALFTLRGLRSPSATPIWEAMGRAGFAVYDATTLAAIGRPWLLLRGLHRDVDFATFEEPGWGKLAMDFHGEDGRLVTETRVLLTDETARRSFRGYWIVVRPFSGLVGRSCLKAAKGRAESA